MLVDPRVRRAVRYIARHLEEPLGPHELAERVGLSSSRFAYLFRSHVAMPPQRYTEEARLDRARQLLEATDHTVQRIAAGLGFECPFYFSTRLRKRFGTSPSQYRSWVINGVRTVAPPSEADENEAVQSPDAAS